MARNKWYLASSLTAADENSLQKVPNPGAYTDLLDEDKCFVMKSNLNLRVYEYDTALTDAEDFYDTIVIPTGNATGTGAWKEKRTAGILSFFAGGMANHFDATVASNGTVITMSFEATGTIPGLGIYSDDLVTVPIQDVTLTAGTDASPQENYVHILQTDPDAIIVATDDWPATEHIKIAYCLVPSAVYVQSDGCYINQNWNDGNEPSGMGHLSSMGENIRLTLGGANYHSGVAGNGATEGYITIDTGDTPDSVYFLSTAGVAFQMHKHTVPAWDTSDSDKILVVNSDVAAYNDIYDISDETADSEGGSLTGRYYNVVMIGVANKGGEYSPLLMNMPGGSYSNVTNATRDVDGYDNYDVPREFINESCTAFLICRLTFRNQSGNLTLHNTTDLRGRTPGTASGSTVGGETTFADNQFEIFYVSDNTAVLSFDCSGITTGTDRVITPADANMRLLATTDADDLTDGNETTLHKHASVPALTDTSDATISAIPTGVDVNNSGDVVELTIAAGAAKLLNKVDGGTLTLAGEVATDTENTFAKFTAGGAGTMYHNNDDVLTTRAFGVNIIRDTASSLYVTLDVDASGVWGQVIRKPGAGFTVTGRNVGDTADNMLISGDPDGSTGIYDTGVLKANTTSEGLQVDSVLKILERSSDPAEPGEGESVTWMSDGTGKGDDGDVLVASKAGGTTTYTIIHDHSAGSAW